MWFCCRSPTVVWHQRTGAGGRRSWTRTSKSTPEALMAGRPTRVRKVFRQIGVRSRVENSRSVGIQAPRGDPVGQLVDQVGRDCHGAGLVVLGVGLGQHPGAGGEFLIETSTTVSSTVSVRSMRSRW